MDKIRRAQTVWKPELKKHVTNFDRGNFAAAFIFEDQRQLFWQHVRTQECDVFTDVVLGSS